MRAIVLTKYGSPDVLKLEETAKPAVKDNELLIRVGAASVTPSDCAFRKADPFMIRLMYGFMKPKNRVPGTEFAGVVEAVGKEVSAFKPGDRVYGMSPHKFGAHAEYISLPDKEPIGIMPANLSSEEAAAVIDGGLTALTFLRDIAKARSGQKVLINGASGAVGIYAVQLAKHFGAEVTGVCSGANAELVRSYGADYVIDYTREDFRATGRTYDVIFDAVGKSSYPRCKSSLNRSGIYLGTVPTGSILFHMLWTALFSSKKAKFAATGLMQKPQNLAYLRELAEAGKLRPVIDRRYPLEQLAAAHEYVEQGRKKGNVIVVMDHR